MSRLQTTITCGRVLEAVDLYGWDSRTGTWHGPNEIGEHTQPDRRLLRDLRSSLGRSWYSPLTCCSQDEAASRFFVMIHELSDCAVASIYCHETKAGPAEIMAVIPSRRQPLREDFAFEFLSFARFLGVVNAGAELLVHDAIAGAIAEARPGHALVLSLSSGLWPSDLEPVLACCVEKVAVTLCQWLDEPAEVQSRIA